MDTSSKTQKIYISSRSSSVIKPNSSPASSTGGTSAKVVGGTSRIASISKAASANFKTSTSVAKAAVLAAPLVVGTVVSGVAAVFYGVSNMIRYGKSEKSGTQAFRDTVAGSAGVGVSAGLGVAASNVIAGTSLALGSTVVVPIAAGTAAAFAGMKIWNKIFFKKQTPLKTK